MEAFNRANLREQIALKDRELFVIKIMESSARQAKPQGADPPTVH